MEIYHFHFVRTDRSIPTIGTDVANTETGHCQKSLAIFQLILNELTITGASTALSAIDWIVLADDDTLLK